MYKSIIKNRLQKYNLLKKRLSSHGTKEFILSKRFFGILTFFNYVIADGIFELLKKSSIGIKTEYKKSRS